MSLWNGNLHVRTAATNLSKYILNELSSEAYRVPPTGRELESFVKLLQDATVEPEPTSAAPGTSDHGQLRAVDFVVYQGSQLVAGTDTSAILPVWKAQGWEEKLVSATKNTGLIGPLQHPYEPWHWRLA